MVTMRESMLTLGSKPGIRGVHGQALKPQLTGKTAWGKIVTANRIWENRLSGMIGMPAET